MCRQLFTLCSTISLLLCIAAGVFWARSYRTADYLVAGYWDRRPHPLYPGYVTATHLRVLNCDGRLDAGTFPSGCVGGPGRPARAGPGEGDERLEWTTPTPKEAASLRAERFVLHGPGPRWAGLDWYSRKGRRFLSVPDAGIMLPMAILPACWFYHALRRRRRATSGLCASCGYDLRATPDRCPECGAPAAAPG